MVLLDCTLRDGGYAINWQFGLQIMRSIVSKLISSGVDVIELGFLDERVQASKDKTITPDMNLYNMMLEGIDKKSAKFYAMIDYGTFSIEKIPNKSQSVVDGIRVIFTQDKIEDAVAFCSEVSKKGYEVFANAVNITNYGEDDFKRLFDAVNKTSITGVSIVDTYGGLFPDDALALYKRFDNGLKKEFAIGFHAHDTQKLAMGNCLSIISDCNPNRTNYIDGTLGGMGKGAGNAHTELLARVLNSHSHHYDLPILFETVGSEITKFNGWGYNLGRSASLVHNVYYKYTDYYTNCKNLGLDDVLRIEALIPDQDRFNYSIEKAEYYFNLYFQHRSKYKCVIFDIDGTILDTTDGIIRAIDYTIEECKLPEMSYDDKLYFIGPPIEISFKNAYGLTDEQADEVAQVFRKRYKNNELFNAHPYDGIMQLFADLKSRGIMVGIATNKRESYTLELLKHFGITQFCDSIHGTDSEGKRSKADIISLVLTDLGIYDKTGVVMVGDCEGDCIAANKAGVDFIPVTYGFGFTTKSAGNMYVKSAKDLGNVLL